MNLIKHIKNKYHFKYFTMFFYYFFISLLSGLLSLNLLQKTISYIVLLFLL